MTLYDNEEELDSDDRRISHQARRNGDFFLKVEAEEEGEYVYQLRVNGVALI